MEEYFGQPTKRFWQAVRCPGRTWHGPFAVRKDNWWPDIEMLLGGGKSTSRNTSFLSKCPTKRKQSLRTVGKSYELHWYAGRGHWGSWEDPCSQGTGFGWNAKDSRHCGVVLVNTPGACAPVTEVLFCPVSQAKFISGCWKGTSSQLSKLGPRRNSAHPVCMCFVD